MHEMALAEGILDIAEDYARRNDASRVTKIGILIGEMTGAEPEALSFAFEALSRGTVADGAKIVIRRVPLAGRCAMCGEERTIEGYDFRCRSCGGVLIVTQGREMKVEYLEME